MCAKRDLRCCKMTQKYSTSMRGPIGNLFVDLSETGLWTYRKLICGQWRLKDFSQGGAKSINFWYKGARDFFCPPLSICSGGGKIYSGRGKNKQKQVFFHILREQNTLFHTSLTLLQRKISEIWHKNALCVSFESYFFC